MANPTFGAAPTANTEEIISVARVQQILNSNVAEVQNLCKKASLRPRKDELGNVYFSRSDVDVLKKVKELYEHTRLIQEMKKKDGAASQSAPAQNASQNLLARAKARLRNEVAVQSAPKQPQPVAQINYNEALVAKLQNSFATLEEKIMSRMNDLLSEKMDGLDEVILELIRSKTENETLRARLNDLNKENFTLKNEATNYKSIGLGFYVKRDPGGY